MSIGPITHTGFPPVTPAQEKKKRKSRARTKPGERITLYGLLAMLAEFQTYSFRRVHGHGTSLYLLFPGREEPKHASLLWVVSRKFETVVQWALEGRIYTCLYLDPNPPCRCKACDQARVKNPRKKKQPSILEELEE